MRGSARSGRSPQPSPPASTSPSSPSSNRHASTSRARFLRGSIVPRPRIEGPPRSAAGPSGPRPGSRPGGAWTMRSDSMPSSETRSAAVAAEFAKTTSHVRAAFRALCVCIEIVLAVHHSGCRRGIRSWKTVARTPARCAGYIHSLKRKASNDPASRSTAGCPARLQAVRSACEAGSGRSVERIGIPSSAARIRPGPRRLVGAKATSSCRPAPAIPAMEPRM